MIISKDAIPDWVEELDSQGVGVWDWDLKTDEVFYSRAWKAMLGYEEDEVESRLDSFAACLHPDNSIETSLDILQAHFAGKVPVFSQQIRMLAKDGSYRWVLAQGSVVERDENGKPLRMTGIHTDITESQQAYDQLQERNVFIDKVLNTAPHYVYIFDLVSQSNIYSNNTVYSFVGYSPQEIQSMGSGLLSEHIFHPDDLPNLLAHIQAVANLEDGKSKEIEYRVRHKQGHYLYFRSYDTPFSRDEKGQVTQIIGNATEITDLKRYEQDLQQMAQQDSLTQLPNRHLLNTRLQHSMQVCNRLGSEVCVCFIDLDNFKNINDSFGHSFGDKVLIEVADRMQALIRQDDTVARVGGDEFVLVLENIRNRDSLDNDLQRFFTVFEQPFNIDGYELNISASMGFSLYPEHGCDLESLNQFADTAMYQAKNAGKNRIQMYSESMSHEVINRLELENDLREAIKQEQFEMHYQPQVDLSSGEVIGLESLIRWRHPVKGLIPPNDFIPLAEELGLIVPLGDWIFQQVCQDSELLLQRTGFNQSIAVNVSVVQLDDENFVQSLKRIIEQQQVCASRFELEITESVFISNTARVISLLKELKQLGFQISLDDFGIGYSSLRDLKLMPVSKVKIDKVFIDDLTESEYEQLIIKMIVSLANTVKMDVIAEGIETVEQQQRLLASGCIHGQGYLFSRPLPFDELIRFLAES